MQIMQLRDDDGSGVPVTTDTDFQIPSIDDIPEIVKEAGASANELLQLAAVAKRNTILASIGGAVIVGALSGLVGMRRSTAWGAGAGAGGAALGGTIGYFVARSHYERKFAQIAAGLLPAAG